MEKTKEVLITTETREVIVIRKEKIKRVRYFCPTCQTKSEMVSVLEAVSRFNFEIREIVELFQSNKLHSLITKNRQYLFCSTSLAMSSNEAVNSEL